MTPHMRPYPDTAVKPNSEAQLNFLCVTAAAAQLCERASAQRVCFDYTRSTAAACMSHCVHCSLLSATRAIQLGLFLLTFFGLTFVIFSPPGGCCISPQLLQAAAAAASASIIQFQIYNIMAT